MKVPARSCSSKGSRETSFPASAQLWRLPESLPRLARNCILLISASIFTWPSLPVSISESSWIFSYKNTIGFRPHPNLVGPLLNSIPVQRLCLVKITFWGRYSNHYTSHLHVWSRRKYKERTSSRWTLQTKANNISIIYFSLNPCNNITLAPNKCAQPNNGITWRIPSLP